MPTRPKVTVNVARVLAAMLTDPDGEHYGYPLMHDTGLKSGGLYPILARLEVAGWVASRWENINPAGEHRPARRIYRFTDTGRAEAREELDRLAGIVGVT